MKKQFALALVLLVCGTVANAQGAPQSKMKAKPDHKQKPTLAMVLDHSLSGVEHDVVPAAEAMPEAKFNFAPTDGEFKGVRTFAQQAKHIAAVNYLLGASILGEKSPVDLGGENGPDKITSKADVVKFLKDSFAYLRKALNTLDEKNGLGEVQSPFGSNQVTRLGLAVIAISHPFDHYGQMVEYLRMNGIIPPASRK
jgi:DinB superfamily